MNPAVDRAALVYDFNVVGLTDAQRAALYATLLALLRNRLGWYRRQYSFYLHNNRPLRAQIAADVTQAIIASPIHQARIQRLDVFCYNAARADWTLFARAQALAPPP